MEKIAILVLVLANFGLQSSDAKVQVPFSEDILTTRFELNVVCNVVNETFVGWFKDDTGTKIPQVASRSDVKNQTAVYVVPGDKLGEQRCHLIFPKGSPASAGGIYTCQGKTNSAKLKIVVKFNLKGLKTSQQLHAGQSGKIVLGALSYPLSKITWKKDNKALDFSDARLSLEKDGSIVFTKVLQSDAGSYDARVNWESRKIVDINVKVTVVAHVTTERPTTPIAHVTTERPTTPIAHVTTERPTTPIEPGEKDVLSHQSCRYLKMNHYCKIDLVRNNLCVVTCGVTNRGCRWVLRYRLHCVKHGPRVHCYRVGRRRVVCSNCYLQCRWLQCRRFCYYRPVCRYGRCKHRITCHIKRYGCQKRCHRVCHR